MQRKGFVALSNPHGYKTQSQLVKYLNYLTGTKGHSYHLGVLCKLCTNKCVKIMEKGQLLPLPLKINLLYLGFFHRENSKIAIILWNEFRPNYPPQKLIFNWFRCRTEYLVLLWIWCAKIYIHAAFLFILSKSQSMIL